MVGFDYAAKVRALLASAASEEDLGNDGAAATLRAKALEWMDRYKIAEEAALAEDPTSSTPISTKLVFKPHDYVIDGYYVQMLRTLAQHTEVRLHVTRIADWSYEVTVVGYEGDVRYFEFLWTSSFLMFTTKIDPVWNCDLTTEENIFYMRQAGFKRADIANMAGWDGTKAADRSKVQRIYLAEAKRRGEMAAATGLGFQGQNYRQAYAEGFITNLRSRLRRARDAANASGGVVELAGRKDRVDEAFYELFPQARPTPSAEVAEYMDPRNSCKKCAKAKSRACNDHSYMRPRSWTQADERRFQSRVNGPSARAGRTSGREAAEGVLLRGTNSPTAQRVERAHGAIEG